MGLFGGRRYCWAAFCTITASAYADSRLNPAGFNAHLNIRHHLIPGLKLNAKNQQSIKKNTDPGVISGEMKSTFENVRQPVPPPPATTRKSELISWDNYCKQPLKVSFFGDYWVAPHSPAAKHKESLFDNLRPILSWADFNVVNFEGSITNSTKRAFPKFPFALKQAPDSLKWLSAAGVKHFTRANNHSMDFGWEGAQSTTVAIHNAGLSSSGLGNNLKSALKPMWLNKNGMKIAVISVTTTYPAEAWAGDKRAGVAFPRADALRSAIKATRDEADFIVVAFHWGEELKPTLRPHQQEYAKMVLQAGADIVVGHHAHVAQKIDIEWENEVVVYGLGNFIFTSLSRDAKFGLGSHFEFCRAEVPEADGTTHRFKMVLTPLLTYNRGTGYRTRLMNLNEFLPFAREYVKTGYFSPELEFYIPDQGQVKSLAELLQPRAQASKDGPAVR